MRHKQFSSEIGFRLGPRGESMLYLTQASRSKPGLSLSRWKKAPVCDSDVCTHFTLLHKSIDCISVYAYLLSPGCVDVIYFKHVEQMCTLESIK